MAVIVHFGKYYLPDVGGIESVTASLAKGAADAGHDVSVVCFQKVFVKEQQVIDGVKIIGAPISIILFSQPLGLAYFAKSLFASSNADIVHLHTPNMLGVLCALFIPAKVRLLVHWHSDVINMGILGTILTPLVATVLRRANRIIVTSSVYANSSIALSKFSDKISVVPIGVSGPKNVDSYQQLSLSLEKSIHGRKIILSVGRLVPYKGFDTLIQATHSLVNDSVVIVVGDGQMHQKLEQLIIRSGLEDRVLLVGRLSDRDLHTLFKRATLFCLTSISRAEAFGVVLLEAMSYGLPIVASDIPGSGVPWVNQHGISGLNFPAGNACALAEACNQILSSTELRDKFSYGARQRFLSEFTEEVSISRFLTVYKFLLGDIDNLPVV